MKAAASQVDLALHSRVAAGESPTWSEQEYALYWVDIEEPALHRLDPETGFDQSWETPSDIGAILVALRTEFAKLTLASDAFEHLRAPPYIPLRHRFDEGKCDARGRFWIGTMYNPLRGQVPQSQTARTLGAFTRPTGFGERWPSAVIPNGLARSPDSRCLNLSDSNARKIWRSDYDLETADLSSQRLFPQFGEAEGTPDGAAVDEEGFYWCPLYGGGGVVRLSPEGRPDWEIPLPVSQPTMCALGNADYDSLYITSAAHGVENEPHAGSAFCCRRGVKGLPPALFSDG